METSTKVGPIKYPLFVTYIKLQLGPTYLKGLHTRWDLGLYSIKLCLHFNDDFALASKSLEYGRKT